MAEGAIVLKVNYRGSAGYGEAFRTLNYRNLGAKDCPLFDVSGRCPKPVLTNDDGLQRWNSNERGCLCASIGVGDAWDVLSGVDYLVGKGWIDEDKMVRNTALCVHKRSLCVFVPSQSW